MRYLLIYLPDGLTEEQRADLSTPLFEDVQHLDCHGGADARELPVSRIYAGRSASLDLPCRPIVLLLENYSGSCHFTVELKQQGYNHPTRHTGSTISIYCAQAQVYAQAQEHSRAQASKQQPAAYPLAADPQYAFYCPILISICYHLAFDFSLRRMYMLNLESCINLSGRSKLLQCMPDFLCTENDSYLQQVYDTKRSSTYLMAYYSSIMGYITSEEQENIAVVVGAMIDSVSVVLEKSDFMCRDSNRLEFASRLIMCERLYDELELPQIRGFESTANNCMAEYSVFDIYDRTLYARLKTPAARYYTHLAFDAYINYYYLLRVFSGNQDLPAQKDPGRQTPRTVMLRRSAFAELIRMFMNDSGDAALGLVHAESIIRKTLLLHLRHLSQDAFFVNLTDEIDDFAIDSISVVKLGARKQAQHNMLPVHAYLQMASMIPCSTHQHYDALGNNICFVQTVKQPNSSYPGVVTWKQDEAYWRAKFYVSRYISAAARRLGVDYSHTDLASCALSYQQYLTALESVVLLGKEQDKEKDKSSSKKVEAQTFLLCGCECVDESDERELIQSFNQAGEKDKKGALQIPRNVGNCYLQTYSAQLFYFMRFVIHKRYIMLEQALYKYNEDRGRREQYNSDDNELEESTGLILPFFDEPTRFYASSYKKDIIYLLGAFEAIRYKTIGDMEKEPQQPQVGTKYIAKGKPDQTANYLFDDLCELHPYLGYAVYLAFYEGDEQAFFHLNVLQTSIDLDVHPVFLFEDGQNVVFNSQNERPKAALVLMQFLQAGSGKVPPQFQLKAISDVLSRRGDRNFGSFSVMTADRSVFNGYPDTGTVELVRKWNSLQQQLSNYEGISQDFTDRFQFIGQDYEWLTAINKDNLFFRGVYPKTAKLFGALQDKTSVTVVGPWLSMRKDDIVMQTSYSGQVYLHRYLDVQSSLLCQLLAKDAKRIDCELDSRSLRICLPGQEILSIPNIAELELEKCEANCLLNPQKLANPLQFQNFVTGVVSQQLGFLRRIIQKSGEQTDLHVIDAVEVAYIVSLTKIYFEKGHFEEQYLRDDASCTIVELQLFKLLAFVFHDSKTVILIGETGDVTMLDGKASYVLKQDGSFFCHFQIASAAREFYSRLDASSRQLTPQDKKRGGKYSAEVQSLFSDDAKLEYTTPILLYGGQGFHFWHSILERRKRFLSNVDLTTRLCFEKRPPVMKNQELLSEFQLLEPFYLLFEIVELSRREYQSLVHLSPHLDDTLQQADLSFTRIHHELFLPTSSIYCSKLSGVYRFILGEASASYLTPFYPSVSTIDWNGNTVHLRVGAPFEHRYTVQQPAAKSPPTPKQNGKQSAKPVVPAEIRSTYCSQLSCEPVLPPLVCDTIHTDVVGEIDKLISKREQAMEKWMKNQAAAGEEKRQEEPANATKGKKPAQKKKKDEPEQIEEVYELAYPPRDVDTILNELEHIEVLTVAESFKGYVAYLAGADGKSLLGKRGDEICYEGQMFDDFIKEAIPNTEYPSPISPIIRQRYIVVPASPDYKYYKGDQSYDYSSHSFCTIENDVPWMVIDNQEISPLLFFAQLLYFYNITNFYTFVHQYVTRISTRAPISQIPGYSYQPVVKQALLQLVLAVKPLPEMPQFEPFLPYFDATFYFQEIQQYESYIQIFNFASENDVENWKKLETTKKQWREITRNRERLLDAQKDKETMPLDGELVDLVKSVIQAYKEHLQLYIEEERIRQEAYELEKQRQQELLVEQAQAEKPKEYDHLIDKPLNNQKQHKMKEVKNKQISPFLSPRSENEEVEDDDNIFYHKYQFGISSVLQGQSDKYLRQAKQQMGNSRTLPRIGVNPLPGALHGTLKLMPASVCSRCTTNYIQTKNLTEFDVDVTVEYDRQLISIKNSEFTLPAGQSLVVEIAHSGADDSLIKFASRWVDRDGKQGSDIQVIESKLRN